MYKVCVFCGNAFEAQNKRRMYCSDKCRREGDKRQKRINYKAAHPGIGEQNICVICGKHFISPQQHSNTCSKNCATKLSHLKQGYVKAYETRECVICGNTFIISKAKPNSTCSAECTKKKWGKKYGEWYRMKRFDTPILDEDITLLKLFYRDNGVCHICGGRCDYNDKFYKDNGTCCTGRMYPTIDHIMPISKGGTHSWNNIKLAHKHCNSAKGNRFDIKPCT